MNAFLSGIAAEKQKNFLFLENGGMFMKKRAILFGMFHYKTNHLIKADELSSTAVDVQALEKRLQQLQFETTSYMDLSLKDMEQRISEFATEAPCSIFFWPWRT